MTTIGHKALACGLGCLTLAGCMAAPATAPADTSLQTSEPPAVSTWYESALLARAWDEVPTADEQFVVELEAPSATSAAGDLSGPGHDEIPIRYERAVEERTSWPAGGREGRAELLNAYGQLIYRVEEGEPGYEGIIPAGDYTLRLSRAGGASEPLTPLLTIAAQDAGTTLERTLSWLPPAAEANRGDSPDVASWGTFTLDREKSDDINAKINTAVARMNVIVRQIMRPRLRSLNVAYPQVGIDKGTDGLWHISRQGSPPLAAPGNGAHVRTDEPGSRSIWIAVHSGESRLRLTQMYEDLEQKTDMILVGNALTWLVEVRSPRLPSPMTYKLIYRRVGD